MARPVQQIVDYLAAEPVRVSAILRLPLIGLILVATGHRWGDPIAGFAVTLFRVR